MAKSTLQFAFHALLPGGHPPCQLPPRHAFSQLRFKPLETQLLKGVRTLLSGGCDGLAVIHSYGRPGPPATSCPDSTRIGGEAPQLIAVQLVTRPRGTRSLIKNAKGVNRSNQPAPDRVFGRVSPCCRSRAPTSRTEPGATHLPAGPPAPPRCPRGFTERAATCRRVTPLATRLGAPAPNAVQARRSFECTSVPQKRGTPTFKPSVSRRRVPLHLH